MHKAGYYAVVNVLARGLSCYKYITNLEDIFAQESLPPRALAVLTGLEPANLRRDRAAS